MSTSYSVEIKNAKELEQAMRKYPKIASDKMGQAIKKVGFVLAKHTTKGIVPFKTGRLLQSFRYENSKLSGRWSPNVTYATYVHDGTRPHTIIPNKAKALFWAGAGHPVKKVNHPGTKANPFMERILQQSQRDIDTLFENVADAIVKEVAKQASS